MVKIHIPITEGHLIAIGKITIYFALIDLALNVSIWNLIGGKLKKGQIITADLLFSQKRDLFKALYIDKNKDSERLAELDKLIGRIKQAGETRNYIAHCIWATKENQKPLTIDMIKSTIKKKSGLEHKIENTSAEDLDKIAESFEELATDIFDFMEL
jgi:hypothetical protein